MGWTGGDDIFEPVARVLVDSGVYDRAVTDVLEVLIRALRERDWDTEEESLGLFLDYPAVVEAFRRNGIERNDEEDQ